MFGHRVIVTESYIPEFSLSSFFASFGGSLGLWLGVGAVQIITSCVSIVTWIQEKLQSCVCLTLIFKKFQRMKGKNIFEKKVVVVPDIPC